MAKKKKAEQKKTKKNTMPCMCFYPCPPLTPSPPNP